MSFGENTKGTNWTTLATYYFFVILQKNHNFGKGQRSPLKRTLWSVTSIVPCRAHEHFLG
jgi:hypothetical protein